MSNGEEHDPDDFYRDYRGVQEASHNYSDKSTSGMAATASESRPLQSSLRSNGNGTTPKHPSLAQARNQLKPSTYRSTSSPLEDRPGLNNAKSTSALNGYTRQPSVSVKAISKQFEKNTSPAPSPSPSVARKPSPRINTSAAAPAYLRDRGGYQTRNANSSPAGTSRAGSATRDAAKHKSPTSTRPTQRTRFAAEDQHSNNTLSGAARIPRPRNGVSGINQQASKSMSNLSPTSPTSPQTQTSRPLFGEIVPNEQGTSTIAYGIPRAAARRTSDSSLHPSWQQHSRSKSNEASPTSPDAWYKGETDLDNVDPNKPRPRSHNRNHSDFPDSKVNTMNGVTPSFQTSNPPASVQAPTRLPGPSKRQSTSSTSSIPSTRSNSPFTSNGIKNSKLRKPEQRPWSPAGRANTPTSTRAKTPTPRHSPRGKAREPEKSTPNNASLKAYISAPLPKTSPPLRSSRPRQPVSSATTATPRSKAADRSGSPQHVRTGMKVTRNNGEGFTVRKQERKISDLPLTAVDFAARRQQIQRAYTKSIHENEQKEIRAANLRRLNERQQAKAAIAAQESQESSQDVEKDEEPVLAEAQPILEAPLESKPSPQPLQISTSFSRPENPPVVVHRAEVDQDSPTLGMPGSFVEDEEPQSAISCATDLTEFDNEPQTEAPRLSHMPSRLDGFSGHISYNEDLMSPEQAYFGMQNMSSPDDESIQIMLDATPVEDHQPESTPTNDVFARDPSPPGAFQQSPEVAEDLPVFASTVTIASPKETTPVHSRPASPSESCDEHISSNDDSPIIPPEVAHQEPVEHDVQIHVAPELSFPDEADYAERQEHQTRLELPALRTALAPSMMINSSSQEFLNTPVTEIDYESSDGGLAATSGGEGEFFDREYMDSPRDDQDSARNFRSSHQSAWTDYSVGTNEEYSEREDSSRPVTTYETEQKPVPPPKELSPVVPPKPEGYSPLPSPRFPAQSQLSIRHELPPLTTGEGLGLGFSDQIHDFGSSTAIPLWPDYSPPPVPPTGDVSPAPPSRTPPLPTASSSMRPESSLYQSSHNDSSRNMESRRPSDDLYSSRPSISTPRSSTQISFDDTTTETASRSTEQTIVPEPVPETEEEKKAAEITRKRLYQRKMVIKEIIETEAVYLKDMNVVEEIYKGTAEACPKLDHTDVKTIFRNTAEIIKFSTKFLDELKSAASSIYSTRSRARQSKAVLPSDSSISPPTTDRFSIAATLTEETDEEKDRKTFIGAIFKKQLKKMEVIYTDYLKHSDAASTRLATLQEDAAVQVWLSECNLVAKDLTKAWNLDALLVKPVQRITRYQLLLNQLAESTPDDHPDYEALKCAREEISSLLASINDLKHRLQLVGQIVGRKRKESNVGSNIVKAFGRRADKLQSNANRPPEDETYKALNSTFSVEFLRLQVVLRDVEDYARHQKEYVAKTLQYYSSMELIMRMSASSYPEIESKWVRFNLSMRDMGTHVIDEHVRIPLL